MIGIVFGNGKSRLNYNPDDFIGKYPTIACNAFFREFCPDIIVSVDNRMVDEVLHSGYQGEFIYPVKGGYGLVSTKGRQNIGAHRGWASGPTATLLMCQLFPQVRIINLIGFDIYGENGHINNVYAGTQNYVPDFYRETVFTNWVMQLADVFKMFPNVQFKRVGNIEDLFPREWSGFSNIMFVSRPVFE